jgi:hypothetical protein
MSIISSANFLPLESGSRVGSISKELRGVLQLQEGGVSLRGRGMLLLEASVQSTLGLCQTLRLKYLNTTVNK